jgi:hypothetical protein
MKRSLALSLAAALMPLMSSAQVIVNDSWTDAGRNNGADPTDTDWWFSTSSSAIEVGSGFLGLVSGASGRGIHGTLASQSLNVGDSLKATYTFTTPATVGTLKDAGLRVGFFDTTGKPGLAADINSSSGSPNAIYNNLLGYMMDFDVNTGTENIAFRERSNASSGQLLATTGDYTVLSTGGSPYSFAASTTYTGVFTITRSGASSLDLTAALFQGATQLSTYTASDSSASTTTFGMLAFHANSAVFGTSSTVNTPDNGIDFSNIKIEYTVPEPSSLSLVGFGAVLLAAYRRRARQ